MNRKRAVGPARRAPECPRAEQVVENRTVEQEMDRQRRGGSHRRLRDYGENQPEFF